MSLLFLSYLAANSRYLILPLLAVLAISGRAQAQNGYCIRKVGEDERGVKVMTDGTRGCDLYQAVKQYPQSDKDGIDLLRQEQLRSIWAANLEIRDDGSFGQPVVKRTCAKPAPGPEPGSDIEEIKICGPKATMFYYVLPNATFIIPKVRTLTPAELAVRKAADEAERRRKDKEAAAAAVLAREESEAFKRVREMEKKVAAAEAKVADAEKRLASVADKEWRVKALPPTFGFLVLAAAWAFLSTLGLAGYRFKYRALTVDNYSYRNPLEATKDLVLKLASSREETARVRLEAEAERKKSAARIRKLESDFEAQRLELSRKLTQNFDLSQEVQSLRRTLKTMKAPKLPEGIEELPAVKILSDRCADLDARYNELDEKYRNLKIEYLAVSQALKEMENADREVYQIRDRQARMLMVANADKIELQEQLEKKQREIEELRQDYGRAQATIAEYEASWSNVLRASNRPPAISPDYPAATPSDAPTKVRRQTRPAGAAPAARSAESPTVTFSDEEPEEVFAGLFQELADIKRQRNIYREGIQQFEELLSWSPASENEDLEQLEDRVKRIVAYVFEICRASSKTLPTAESAAPESGSLPTATQSDIVRITRMANLLDGQTLDISVLRRMLSDVDSVAVADSLKACVHEWSVRSDREQMIYTVHEPWELHDLNRLLCSQLVCGPDLSLMVPEGFLEAVDRVHLAYTPAFSRRAVMRSVPPSAMPQASG